MTIIIDVLSKRRRIIIFITKKAVWMEIKKTYIYIYILDKYVYYIWAYIYIYIYWIHIYIYIHINLRCVKHVKTCSAVVCQFLTTSLSLSLLAQYALSKLPTAEKKTYRGKSNVPIFSVGVGFNITWRLKWYSFFNLIFAEFFWWPVEFHTC